jgi:hypothetical protein
MNILDLIFENVVSVFWVKIIKFLDADPDLGSGMGKIRSGINTPVPQHWF